MWFLLILLGVICAQPARALSVVPPELYSDAPLVLDFSSGPVVFAFEEGLEGWHLLEGAGRVQTQALGGEWALSGEGMLFLDVDLDNVGAISLRQTRRNGGLAFEDEVVFAWFGETYEVAPGIEILVGFHGFEPLAGGDASAGFVSVPDSVRDLDRGLVLAFVAVGEGASGGLDVRGLVDDVTFHPIPEPGTAVPLALALLVLGARGRAAQPPASR
jgi:hypothetical protein